MLAVAIAIRFWISPKNAKMGRPRGAAWHCPRLDQGRLASVSESLVV